MAASQDKGYFGEQGQGFLLGASGYFFVEGPSGSGGHAANAKGFDGIGYNPKADSLIIYDNKSYARSGNVAGASAIDPARNLAKNLDDAVARLTNARDIPYRIRIIDLLRQTRAAVTPQGIAPPSNVRIAVTNYGGNSTGVSAPLAGKGIVFQGSQGVPEAGTATRVTPSAIVGMARTAPVTVPTNQRAARVGALAAAVQYASGWLNDFAVRHAIERAIEQKAADIGEIFARGEGCLLIVTTTVSKLSGGKTFGSLFVQGGATRDLAVSYWERTPRYLQGYPDTIAVETSYMWLPRPATP